MNWRLGLAALLITAFAPSVPADDRPDKALKQVVVPGPLADHFDIVSARKRIEETRGVYIILKLRAKKEVDTGNLFFKAGYFDREKHLHEVDELRFEAGFVLQKGETVNAQLWAGREDRKWDRIVIQKAKRHRREELRAILREFLR